MAQPQATPTAPDVPSGQAAKRDAELAIRAANFVDAFFNTAPIFTRDNKRVIFISNRDGLPQLYSADASEPAAAATRLMVWPERVTSPLSTVDGKALLFRSDKGADENWSFYRVGLDGQSPIELTPGPALNRDSGVVPDGAPERLFFSARKRSEPISTLYEASTLRVQEPKAIYTDPKPTWLVDVSSDAARALLVKHPSQSENYLLIVDTASGSARTLYPGQGKVTINSAAFSPDGKRVYLTTDEGGERQHVLALDATTGKEVARYDEPSAAVLGSVRVAKQGGAIAVSAQAGDHSELRLLEATSLKPRAKVTMPVGAGGLGAFSEDGRRLSASWSTASTPGDLHAIDAKSGKVAPLRSEPRPTLAGQPSIKPSITVLDAFDGGRLPVNVYVPEGEANGPRPVIVSYHGGPAGVSTVGWSAQRAFFLSLGYAVVEPNVRGSGGFGRAFEEADNGKKRLDAFRDVEQSARWAGSQPWANKDRVIAFGGSYGGYTVLVALSRWPELFSAGVNLFGLVNLQTFMATTTGLIREVFLVEFGDPAKDADFLAEISPYSDVDKIADPMFVYAGANDPRVPRSESDLIVETLRQRKVLTEYMVAENEGHSLARRENLIAFLARSARFLEQH